MAAAVETGAMYDVIITDLTYEGLGVAKVARFPLFVSDALPGEHCRVVVTAVKAKFAYADVVERENNAPERADIAATQLRDGMLSLAHLTYPAQLDFKRTQLERQLERAGLLDDVSVAETLGMDDPWRYRNKAQLPLAGAPGHLSAGFYRRGTHEFVPATDFPLQRETINQTVQKTLAVLNRHQLSAYDPATGRGLLRHLIVREGARTGELMLIFVINERGLPEQDALVQELTQALPALVSIIVNEKTKADRRIMGPRVQAIYGADAYTEQLGDFTYHVSSQSFFQVNTLQAERFAARIADAAELSGRETVIDAYCGIGTLTLPLAKRARQVYGVEIVPDAITMAKQNVADNGLSNVTFVADKAEHAMAQWQQAGIEPDVLVVDPPRKGLAPSFVESAIKSKPRRIVYGSCNPATLARDLKRFAQAGYRLRSIQPLDMFPQTHHIESLSVLER